MVIFRKLVVRGQDTSAQTMLPLGSSSLLYFTGDKDHNIALRKIAIGKG